MEGLTDSNDRWIDLRREPWRPRWWKRLVCFFKGHARGVHWSPDTDFTPLDHCPRCRRAEPAPTMAQISAVTWLIAHHKNVCTADCIHVARARAAFGMSS